MTPTTTAQRYKLDYPVHGELTDTDRKILAQIERELSAEAYERVSDHLVRHTHATMMRISQGFYDKGEVGTEGERAFFQLMLDYAVPGDLKRQMASKFQAAHTAP